MTLASGHEAKELEGEELAWFQRNWKGLESGLIRLTPGPWILRKSFLLFADKYYTFKFLPSDVLLVCFPKTGSTWMQEILWTMRSNPDLNNPDAAWPSFVRCPYMQLDMRYNKHPDGALDCQHPLMDHFKKLCPGKNPKGGVCLQIIDSLPQPRTIKTHLSLSFFHPTLLDTCKVVYMARNPKDVMVSSYHYFRLFKDKGYVGTWEEYVDHFMNKFISSNYVESLKEAWEKRNHSNMHIVFYEDLKTDVMGELKRLDTFLGTKLTPQQLENVAQHTTFKELKNRGKSIFPNLDDAMDEEFKKKEGGFFRKGEIGDWKNKFSPELLTKVDAWIEKNITSIGVNFKYSV